MSSSIRTGVDKWGISYFQMAKRLKSEDEVTLKVVPKSGNLSRLAAMVKNEVAVERELRHVNVLKLYDLFDRPKEYYLVYEFTTGGELFDYVAEKHRFTEQDARTIIVDILSALAHVHSKGFVHRDIRPENFRISAKSATGTVKLTGFAFSKKYKEKVSKDDSCEAYEYMSSERLSCEDCDFADDIWSVGILLHVLVCGYLPFFENGKSAQLLRLQQRPHLFDNIYCKGLSDLIKNFILRLLSRNSRDRPTAFAAIKHAWFSEFSEKLLDFEWTTRNMKFFRRYNARRKVLSTAREVFMGKRANLTTARQMPVVHPKQSYMSSLFGRQSPSPVVEEISPLVPKAMISSENTTQSSSAAVLTQNERPLHPREVAMKPSQVSPKPGITSLKKSHA